MWQPAWASLSRESPLTLHAWYLDFLSHHLPHVKRLLVRCQYDKHLMPDCVHAQTQCGRPLHYTHYSHMHTHTCTPHTPCTHSHMYTHTPHTPCTHSHMHTHTPHTPCTHSHMHTSLQEDECRLLPQPKPVPTEGEEGEEEKKPRLNKTADQWMSTRGLRCVHAYTQCLPQMMSVLVTCIVELSTFVWCCLYCCITLGHKCVCVAHNFVVN